MFRDRRPKAPRALVGTDRMSGEPFRVLRLAIEARRAGTGSFGVLFTSPRQGDGKSTTAANFALMTAARQDSVLLVDADLQNPALHRIFDVPQAPGLTDALRDGLEPSEVAHSFWTYGPLSVVTAGSATARSADIAVSPAVADFLARARESYDVVAIDSPPALAATDAAGLASHPGIDVVLVVRASSYRRHVAGALRKLALSDAKILGIVVNREGTLAEFAYQ
jgi:capsular exopolysaccharide synthesis family protein